MAVTKTHPIKSTLKAAIDYICNPAKTDECLLVSSFGCSAETADIEFAWTRRLQKEGYEIKRGNWSEAAICKDRVEIYIPSIFPLGFTPEDFISGNERPVRRNPLITSILYYN